jgi:hypothetical protein
MRSIVSAIFFSTVILLNGCGTASSSSTTAGKLSQGSLAGNYVMGQASCEKGQFDPVKGAEVLIQNQRLLDLAKDNLNVKVSLSQEEFKTVAPAPFYGVNNKSCSITTVEKVVYPAADVLSKRLVSRSCSTSCSTSDCKEEKSIAGSSPKFFAIDFQAGKLYLTDRDSSGVCVSVGSPYRAKVEYSK